MAYDARIIANEFIEKAKESKTELTNMQLQKLVYIAHGWASALLNDELIYDPIERGNGGL